MHSKITRGMVPTAFQQCNSPPVLAGLLILTAVFLLPSSALAQPLHIQEVSSLEYQEEGIHARAVAFATGSFSRSGEQWSQLEKFVKEEAARGPDFMVLLFYQDRWNAPDLRMLESQIDVNNPSKDLLLRLIDEITTDCVLMYVKMRSKGSFIQFPAEQQAEIRRLIDQLPD